MTATEIQKVFNKEANKEYSPADLRAIKEIADTVYDDYPLWCENKEVREYYDFLVNEIAEIEYLTCLARDNKNLCEPLDEMLDIYYGILKNLIVDNFLL